MKKTLFSFILILSLLAACEKTELGSCPDCEIFAGSYQMITDYNQSGIADYDSLGNPIWGYVQHQKEHLLEISPKEGTRDSLILEGLWFASKTEVYGKIAFDTFYIDQRVGIVDDPIIWQKVKGRGWRQKDSLFIDYEWTFNDWPPAPGSHAFVDARGKSLE